MLNVYFSDSISNNDPCRIGRGKKMYSAAAMTLPEFVPDKEIHLSMEYLANHTLPSGRFVYNANINPDIKYSSKQYNALRHAGTLYAMYLCERYLNDYSLRDKRYLASKYFVENYVKLLEDGMYAVVSKTEEEKLKAPAAKLGGSGLALIGLSTFILRERLIWRFSEASVISFCICKKMTAVFILNII